MDQQNIILDKSYKFALRVIKLYKYLSDEKKEYTLSKQILRCGTSIGANAEEAVGGQSRKDFIAKFQISYKETRETHYWLRLLKDSGFLDKNLAESLLNDCTELQKIISSILNTAKNK